MKAFAALADPTRARIVEAIADEDLTVTQIVAMFPMTQPAISRHLRILREAGLVVARAEGTKRRYRLDPRPLREIDDWLQRYRRLWARRLDNLERHMDMDTESEKRP